MGADDQVHNAVDVTYIKLHVQMCVSNNSKVHGHAKSTASVVCT